MYRRILIISIIVGFLYIILSGSESIGNQGNAIQDDITITKETRENDFSSANLSNIESLNDENEDIYLKAANDSQDLSLESICQDELAIVKDGWYEEALIKDAWDEKILVKKGSCTEILVSEAFDTEEMVYLDGAFYGSDTQEGYVCNGCGIVFFDDGINDHIGSPEHPGWHNELIAISDPYWHNVEIKTIHHDAVYEMVCEEDEYEIIHHDAEYATVYHEPLYEVVNSGE